jgi:ABC-2 type transport system ATP-binding protein
MAGRYLNCRRGTFKNSQLTVRVRTPEPERLAGLVATQGGRTSSDGPDGLIVTELGLPRIGDLAFDNGIRLHQLAPVQASLEQAFMELTKDSVEYHASVPAAAQEA